MECKEVPWPDPVIQQKYCIEDSEWPSKDRAYECKINLLTGRTHQVVKLFLSVVFQVYLICSLSYAFLS